MTIYLIKDTELSAEVFTAVYDLLTAVDGTIQFKCDPNEFPKYHFVVILDEIESYTSPGHKFFISKLITHNSGYGNLKITEDLYDRDSTTIDLKNSFITRDKFLIPVNEVMPEKIYGIFDLLKLEDKSEY